MSDEAEWTPQEVHPKWIHEFTWEEWWNITRHLRPDLSHEDFTVMWDEFLVACDDYQRKRVLQ